MTIDTRTSTVIQILTDKGFKWTPELTQAAEEIVEAVCRSEPIQPQSGTVMDAVDIAASPSTPRDEGEGK